MVVADGLEAIIANSDLFFLGSKGRRDPDVSMLQDDCEKQMGSG